MGLSGLSSAGRYFRVELDHWEKAKRKRRKKKEKEEKLTCGLSLLFWELERPHRDKRRPKEKVRARYVTKAKEDKRERRPDTRKRRPYKEGKKKVGLPFL